MWSMPSCSGKGARGESPGFSQPTTAVSCFSQNRHQSFVFSESCYLKRPLPLICAAGSGISGVLVTRFQVTARTVLVLVLLVPVTTTPTLMDPSTELGMHPLKRPRNRGYSCRSTITGEEDVECTSLWLVNKTAHVLRPEASS